MVSRAEIEMVLAHIDLGAEHIRRQHHIIARLRALGADTALAQELLANFEDAQSLHHAHLHHAQTENASAPTM